MRTFLAFLGVMLSPIWGPVLMVYVIFLTLLGVFGEVLLLAARLILTLVDVLKKKLHKGMT